MESGTSYVRLQFAALLFFLVRYVSICLILIWIIYVFGAFLGGSGSSNWIWAIIWCALNIACFAAVLYGLAKNKRFCLLPALAISIFDIIVGVINILINFISLNWFAAIWLLAIACLTIYYAVGLVTVLEELYSSEEPAAEQEPVPEKPQTGVLHV